MSPGVRGDAVRGPWSLGAYRRQLELPYRHYRTLSWRDGHPVRVSFVARGDDGQWLELQHRRGCVPSGTHSR